MSAHGDGGVVLYGRCDEDLGVPYQPWIEALSPLVAHAPANLIAAHVSARGGELARLVPGLAERADVSVPVASDAVAERYALFGAITDLLQRTAAHWPILLVLDDLHWADKPTVQLMRHLAGVAEGMRLMVIANYRPTDISASHPLAEAFSLLHRFNGVEFVDLAGLDDTELLDLMEATAGHELDDDGLALRDAIAAETNGNAFFATEILRHLAETGAITYRDGRWTATADLAAQGLPKSIRHVVGERVMRLGPEAQRLLMIAAVIGRDFELGLLVEVADADEADVLDVLDAAVGASLLWNVGPDRYSFAHALVEHTLYEELTPSRVGRLHRRIAIALEARCGADPGERIGELAYHWSTAVVPEDRSKAIDYARRAGDRALVQLAPDEALRWYA
ncbi:MAG: AAA family ATPase, partial [Actinomycetota bacterium]|nr:AAA family ATPase [Actinomycetota bacterium]